MGREKQENMKREETHKNKIITVIMKRNVGNEGRDAKVVFNYNEERKKPSRPYQPFHSSI